MILKNKPRENWIFFGLVFVVFLLGAYGLIKTPRKTSVVENRSLAQFSHIDLEAFSDGSFQGNFENALSDQFVMSEKIRSNYQKIMQKMPKYGIDKAVCLNHYMEVLGAEGENRRAFFDCEDYLVGYPLRIATEDENAILSHIRNYNRVNGAIDAYYYYVDNFFAFDFETNMHERYEDILRNNLIGEQGIDSFNFNDYEDYKKYYYKTDHHWNYDGAYIGYSEIAKMMGIEDTLRPVGLLTNYDLFYGTSSRLVQNYDSKEEFYYYDFDLPSHDVYINNKLSCYGHYEDYKNGKYTRSETTNYYHLVYGSDIGEVVFDYYNAGADNLLIISDSYGDPIKELLAASFNKTYAVDLRKYKQQTGLDFKFDEYIKKNNIDKVLFIVSPTFLTKEDRNQGLEL